MNYANKDSKTFCVMPYLSLATEPSGKVKICCHSRNTLEIDKKEASLADASLKEFWNSDTINEIRTALNNGELHPNCKLCWKEEESGYVSKRIRDNKMHKELMDDNFDAPKILDLKLGNKCNIACRTCGSHSSTGWIEEEIFLGDKLSISEINEDMDSISACYSSDNPLWKNINDWLHGIKHFDFYGGEPMIIEDHWKIIKKSVEQGHSKDQYIHYNTNGTVYRKKYIDWFKEFKKVDIQFSIDGINDRFEFMRYPAKWKLVLNNIEKYLEFQKNNNNIMLGVCTTISSFNIFYIDEIIKFFADKGIGVYLNLLHFPFDQNVTNLPSSVKEIITNKLSKNVDKNFAPHIDDVLNFMNSTTGENKEYISWIKELKKHDEYRKQSFLDLHSEYVNILPDFSKIYN